MQFIYLLTIAGFIILITGANYLVDGAASLGKKLKMSSLIIGFTIVAAGTSLPELIINIFASVRNQADLAIANIVGSNIMNTLLVIGAAAAIYPIVPTRRTLYSFLPISLLAAMLVAFFAWISISPGDGISKINRFEGIILIFLFFGFLMFSWLFSKNEIATEDEIKEFSILRSLIYLVGGIGGLYFGGRWVIDGVTHLMDQFGLSQAIVGITIIAVITSLPELVTSVIAATKKNPGIALGNAMGSNIINVFLVLGVSSVITPLVYSNALNFDVLVMTLSNVAILAAVLIGKNHRISRSDGWLLMIIYFSYIGFLIWRD